jgi:glycerate-2-kinase
LKEYGDLRVHSFIIANNVMAAEAARDYLKARNYDSQVLTTSLDGESREVGYVLASIASEIVQYDRPLKRPAAYVCAGETLVKVEEGMKQNGLGGPSQELAVAVAIRLPRNHRVAGIFLDTDGSDGPTNLAGAIIDSETTRHAETLHLDLYDNLKKHNVSLPLEKLSDAIVTGPTGTNVMDLAVVVVSQ